MEKKNFLLGKFHCPGLPKVLTFGIVVLIMFLLAPLAPAQEAKTIRFAHSEPEINLIDTPYLSLTSVFKTIVEDQTRGRYKIQVFPNGQLGSLRSMAEQVSRGILEISGGQNGGLLASFNPITQLLEAPYTFKTKESGRIALNGSFGKEISDELARSSNIRILLYMPSAFRSFLNSKKEIRTPEDMKGMKIRTMEVPLHVEMVKALGASPTPIPWDELYSALQTGVVDGCESVPYLVVSAKLLEVQKFYTLNNHVMNCPVVIISDKFYKSLSPDDRQIFEYAAREALLAFLGTITAKEVRDIEVIKKAGVKVYVPTPQEIAQFEKPVREPIVQVLRKLGVEQKWIDKMFTAIAESEKVAGWRK